MARLSTPIAFKVVANAGTANSGDSIDERAVFSSSSVRDAYEPNFLYRGLLSYVIATPYHVSGVTSNSGYYTRYFNGSVYSWQGLDANTVDDKHAYGTMDSASTGISDPATSTNIVDHINYIYTVLGGLSSGLTWLDPVTNFADLATTYPTPTVGNSALVTSEEAVYTYNGVAWVKTKGAMPLLSATTDGIVPMGWYTTLNDVITNPSTYLNGNTYSAIRGVTATNNVIGTASATSSSDTFTLKEGNNVTLDVDSSSRTITINSTASAPSSTYTFTKGLTLTGSNVDVSGTVGTGITWTNTSGYTYAFNSSNITLSNGNITNKQVSTLTLDSTSTNISATLTVKPIVESTANQNHATAGFTFTKASTNGSFLISSGTDMTSFRGAEYDKNYATRNTSNPRWIPDKAYVDAAVSGSATAYTFSNGVTNSGTDVTLGGTIPDGIYWVGDTYTHFISDTQVAFTHTSGTGNNIITSIGSGFNFTVSDSVTTFMALRPLDVASAEGECSLSLEGVKGSVNCAINVKSGTDITGFLGIVYDKDYSSRNTSNPRWVPDKAYVDNTVAAFSSNETLLPSTYYYRQTLGINTTGDIRLRYTISGRFTEKYSSLGTWDVIDKLLW